MKVEFKTSAYQMAHGRQPRGRGSWAFIDSTYNGARDYFDHLFWAPADLTYVEAKKVAAVHFAAIGVSSVTVCS